MLSQGHRSSGATAAVLPDSTRALRREPRQPPPSHPSHRLVALAFPERKRPIHCKGGAPTRPPSRDGAAGGYGALTSSLSLN